jgi:glutaredoxin
MEQRCTVVNLYLNWALYLGGAAYAFATDRYILLAAWVLSAPLIQIAYVRLFPHLSSLLGYGSVADEVASLTPVAPVDVTLYTAAGCPFCPIVEHRLEALRQAMGFRLFKVDVTVRPDLLTAKRIKAVPVVEVGGESITGNLTSCELAALIGRRSATVSK